MPEAEDGGEGERGVERPVGDLGLGRRNPEAGVEARQEALEDGLGLGDGGGPGVAELGHQAVLERPGGAFDAPVRLGGERAKIWVMPGPSTEKRSRTCAAARRSTSCCIRSETYRSSSTPMVPTPADVEPDPYVVGRAHCCSSQVLPHQRRWQHPKAVNRARGNEPWRRCRSFTVSDATDAAVRT